MNVVKDIRISKVKSLVEAIVPKRDLDYCNIMVTGENEVVMIVRDTVMYLVQLKNLPLLPPIAMYYSSIEDNDTDTCIVDYNLLNLISHTHSYYKANMVNPVASNDTLSTQEDFESYLALKADDGSKYYHLSGNNPEETYLVPIFSGFPALAKSDSMGVTVYDLHDGMHTLVVMNIFKKKIKDNVQMCFRTLKL